MPKKSAPKRKPKANNVLTISIHGRGVDIDATIDDGDSITALIAQLADRVKVPTADPVPDPPHDFDIVCRVVQHASPEVLQAIATIVTDAQAQRAPSQPDQPS